MTTFDVHKNFAATTVTSAPTPATSGTSLVVTDATVFPATPFNAVIWPVGATPTAANAEVVRVTNISSNTLTITRAQESSVARSVLVGDQIANNITVRALTDIEGAINVFQTVVTKTSNYTATTSDYVIQVNSAGAVTITLFAAATNSGKTLIIKNINTGTVTVDANAAETIDGALTLSIPLQYQSYTIVCDGTGWNIV